MNPTCDVCGHTYTDPSGCPREHPEPPLCQSWAWTDWDPPERIQCGREAGHPGTHICDEGHIAWDVGDEPGEPAAPGLRVEGAGDLSVPELGLQGPAVVLSGSREAVAAVAKLLYKRIVVVPATGRG